MKKLFLFLMLGISALFSLSQETVFEETFSSNEKEWHLLNSTMDQVKITGGVMEWKHSASQSSPLYHFINRLNDQKDFSVEVKIKPTKLGSEYGLYFGGINRGNGNYIFVKGKKFRFIQVKNGKLTKSQDYKTNLNIRMDDNIFKLVKSSGQVTIYVNDAKIFTDNSSILLGKAYGFTLAGTSQVAIDDFKITGTMLPINLAKDMHYATTAENLGVQINSKYEDITPVITPNGQGIYFSRRYSPDNLGGSTDHQDIYYSEMFEGSWSRARNIGKPLNNHGPNAVCAVTPDGNKILLMNTYDNKGDARSQGLSISERTEDGWSLPVDVRIKGYYNKSEFNEFMLSNDGKVMILAIEQNNTRGNRDLYVSFLEADGFWSTPKNMGNTINTTGVELSPFLASDGKTLYFSSTGHPGYGKNDIFMTKRQNNSWTSWSEPVNLGKPLNTIGWDAYYSVPADGEYAYYVSSDNSLGLQDIFRIKLPSEIKPEPVVLIRGYVRNSKTKDPLATGILYDDLDDGKQIGIANSSPKNGYYEIVLPLSKAYSFFAEKEGFYSVRDNINLKDSSGYQIIERDLYLTPIEVGQTMALNNVFFYRGKAQLRPESYAELNKLAFMLKENNNIEILLEGHTDNQGSADLNVKLSEERVKAVTNYLIKKGAEAGQIDGKGWGGEKPKASNKYESTRKLNRRVEFKIVKY